MGFCPSFPTLFSFSANQFMLHSTFFICFPYIISKKQQERQIGIQIALTETDGLFLSSSFKIWRRLQHNFRNQRAFRKLMLKINSKAFVVFNLSLWYKTTKSLNERFISMFSRVAFMPPSVQSWRTIVKVKIIK